MIYKITFYTRRLIIAQFSPYMAENWAERIGEVSRDAANRKFMPDEVFETTEQAREAVYKLISRYDSDDGPFVYPVLLGRTEYIGHIESVKIDRGWEVGYHIAEPFTGLGYASEALEAFAPYIKEKLRADVLYGICRADNAASRRVLEKCGFALEFEGEAQYHGVISRIRRYIFK